MGFIEGYSYGGVGRPQGVFVTQMGVEEGWRGKGIASRLLDRFAVKSGAGEGVGGVRIAAAVPVENVASSAVFARYAEAHNARLTRSRLFMQDDLFFNERWIFFFSVSVPNRRVRHSHPPHPKKYFE